MLASICAFIHTCYSPIEFEFYGNVGRITTTICSEYMTIIKEEAGEEEEEATAVVVREKKEEKRKK